MNEIGRDDVSNEQASASVRGLTKARQDRRGSGQACEYSYVEQQKGVTEVTPFDS